MESTKAPLKINYSIWTKIVKIEESFESIHVSGSGEAAIFTKKSLGWFVTFEGSYEALYFGNTKPILNVGKTVKITFQEVDE